VAGYGFTSALTYDFELFSTAQDRWLEISSVSNFETFQANRLKLRFKTKMEKPTSAYLKRKFIGFAKSVSWNS
jgi:seryl-tRNA synthetase